MVRDTKLIENPFVFNILREFSAVTTEIISCCSARNHRNSARSY